MALFNKQKQEKKKKGENAIGKIIYGFLLFAPLLAILTASLVNIFNENAYTNNETNVDITYKYESNEVNSVDDLIINNIYEFNLNIDGENLSELFTDTNEVNFEFNIISGELDLQSNELSNSDLANLIYDNVNISISGDDYTSTLLWLYCGDYGFAFEYQDDYIITTNNLIIQLQNYSQNINYNLFSYTDYKEIDNVEVTQTETASEDIFYTACNKVEESNLFNWAKTTGTYTVLNNVTTQIGITNTFIPMLMAYWLLISIIYFLLDIALILVWMVHDKIHDLKDAI